MTDQHFSRSCTDNKESLSDHAGKMNVTLFTAIIVTASLIHAGKSMTEYPKSPCHDKNSKAHYEEFVKKHVLKEAFDRNSLVAWKKYLKKQGLWCRTPVQSFIEDSESKVDRICSKDGRRLTDTVTYPGNLCISSSDMLMYEVTIRKTNKGCDIAVSRDSGPVIVACDKVENRCLPVHFQRYEHQSPSNVPCSPARV